ncbi:E1-like protein-activating enzyme Gsa7p/Apg7p [Kwoniella heveanensis CBS 569]|uniref:Ubiquitin-like modifier-activating enzyme ATG7 n=1 Tax=Kwoniella heveanensis TaxID=89924 RepID=D2KCE4_9TREE|nr:CNI00160 [Kwoniella heveanensis]OCF41825.1 E1-like protein-activating enzyme Gsa7p/Apg7p [Kwoniella heveanensis CBS 569]
MPILQFQPLASQPTPSFWSALTSYKLDEARLDDSPKLIDGWLDEGRSLEVTGGGAGRGKLQESAGIDGSVNVGGNAFGDDIEKPPLNSIPLQGILKNFNTLEQFRQVESKKSAFDQVVDMILESWNTDDPMINLFLLVSFADLKRYVYQYWFAFPAVVSKPAWETDRSGFSPADPHEIESVRHQMRLLDGRSNCQQALLVKRTPTAILIGTLSSYHEFFDGIPLDRRTVAFRDPSSSANHPGWPLRNILSYLQRKHGVKQIRVLCLRAGLGSRQGIVHLPASQIVDDRSRPSAVGWERDHVGKLASRSADLGPTLDPTRQLTKWSRLAAQAVDLNLKLMKWRVMPRLDLEKIGRTKCLLLGAGTLGCYVARNLMAWGVRNISFVDSGRVSYSNPVRQPLFRYEDCLNGGMAKASCAAERLREIFPGVIATGHLLSVPMPGHACPELASDLARLETLIQRHDAIFLLMDSRESRWLPTVIGAAHGKVVINAALGFDTYLVMRHGASSKEKRSSRLGCYYCNDVVAPTDSLTDRTLDQMCTVTRPGVAPIAAAAAVELLITILQHPLGIAAPPRAASDHTVSPSSGAITSEFPPHQLRGSIADWRTMLINGPAFEQCTACSAVISEKYRAEGLDFVRRAIEHPHTLENVTGLDKLHEESEVALATLAWSESDSEDEFK